MSDNAFWCTLWLGLATVVGLTIATCVAVYSYRDCHAMSLGYSLKSLPGYHYPVWTKGAR